jgi:3'-5' exoribonuclease
MIQTSYHDRTNSTAKGEMSRTYIDQLRDGDTIDDVYLANDKQHKLNKKGDPYLQVELRDRTGSLMARMWNTGENVFKSFENGDYLQIEGKAQLFQGSLQIILSHVERAEMKAVDVREFLPRTEHDIGQLTERLRKTLLGLSHPHLRALAECFLGDAEFMNAFCACPAGIRIHHAYIGGLLEHTVTMMEIAEKLCPIYPAVDRELLLVGIFLHDSGKIRELSFQRSFGYTDEGQLIGHIPIGVEMLATHAGQVRELIDDDVPAELLARIRHMILSHHGTLEQGSPRVPMTPEAELLHLIDTLDTKMHQILREIRDEKNNPGAWTMYSPANGRKLYKGGPSADFERAKPLES